MRPYVWFLAISIAAVGIVGALDRSGRAARADVLVRKTAAVGAKTEERGPRTEENEALLIPVEGVTADHLKSSFNEARGGGFRIHHALDILAPRGTPVHAAVAGTIRKLFVSKAGGITIYEFDRDEQKVYYYAHLDRYAGLLHEGQSVEQGDVIGYVGTTGNAPANTPHLHFAIAILPPTKEWWKGDPIDPYPLLLQPTTRVSAPQ